MVAAVAHGLYGNQAYIAEQIHTKTCDAETLLKKVADEWLQRIPAAYATGTATITGNDGAVIPAITVLQHQDGRQYRTTDEAIITGGTATLNLVAMEAGTRSHITDGVLSLISPITGVDGDVSAATVSAGAEIEDIERLRDRLLDKQQNPPLGGKDYDYVAWAKAAHVDVTKVWITPHENGIGSIVLRFVTEDLADPIQTAAHIQAVKSYIQTMRPAGLRNFTFEAPEAVELGLAFSSLTPNTPEVQQAIEAEQRDLLRRESIGGATILVSQIREAISAAEGEQDHVINLTENIALANNQFAVVGDIAWPNQQ